MGLRERFPESSGNASVLCADGERLMQLSFFVSDEDLEVYVMRDMSMTRKLTLSALVMALYVVVMILTQAFAFGQYQVRIATALYALAGVFPFLVVPLGAANCLSNFLMGGLGPLDMIGGVTVGLLTAGAIAAARDTRWRYVVTFLAITLIPGLGVPIWLSIILDIPYGLLVAGLLVGQAISGFCGALLLLALRRRFVGEESFAHGGESNVSFR